MKNYFILFGIGAFAYGLLEVIWRGHSHWSMMIAGGLSFVAFAVISKKLRGFPFLYKCILGSLTVTALELVFGVIFNIILGQKVWDYSNIPLNLFGQICLLFSVLWGFLCIAAIPFSEYVLNLLNKKGGKI